MLRRLTRDRPLVARVAAQGAFLLGGYGLAQAFSFVRNALIGHALSKGDFGIAATITMVLQLIDSLSEIGADRLLVQAPDGDEAHFIETAHLVSIARGLVTGVLIALMAVPVADFFAVPHAAWAFAAAAFVPALRGLTHLDVRRAQRRLDNRAGMIVEVAPQAIALVATPIVLHLDPSFAAVLWLALLQTVAAVAASHALATTRYRVGLDRDIVARLFRFGWPIWLSGIPLVAVYQGDRLLIGRMLGMEELAGYSAAFMIAMVPGLIAGKMGAALMLPLLTHARGDAQGFAKRFSLLAEATALAASAYLAVFFTLGSAVLVVAFGPQYAGLGTLTSWLAAMWALRMIQAVPGMALMAAGETRPLLVAGVVRALALPVAAAAAFAGAGVEGIAAAGVLGELASLVYVALRVERHGAGLALALLLRSALIVPFGFLAFVLNALVPHAAGLAGALPMASIVLAMIAGGGLAVLPGLRQLMGTLRPAPRGT